MTGRDRQLPQQFEFDGPGEIGIILRGNHKRARTADHFASEIMVERTHIRQNCQTVDRDAQLLGQKPGVRRKRTGIADPVTGQVDLQLFAIKSICIERRNPGLDGGADCGMDTDIGARRLFDPQIAKWAAVIFTFATFAPTYAFSIWPHQASLALMLGAIYCAIAARDLITRRIDVNVSSFVISFQGFAVAIPAGFLLLALSGDLAAPLLASTEVPAGDYNYIRVYVQAGSPASEVEVDSGGIFDLLLPGQQTGNDNRFLQLVSGFTVPAGGRADFTIDIDLRKALTKPSDKDHYLLRPALRLINNVDVGTLSGSVDSALLQDASCTNDIAADEGVTVYLYRDGSEPLGDINVDEVGEGDHPVDDADGFVDEINPIATAAVKQNQNTGVYEYTLGFIPDGSYRVALTCQSLNDMPDTDEGLAFLQQARVSIVAGQTAMLNFVAANP
mgnify:CR=1 FL=1